MIGLLLKIPQIAMAVIGYLNKQTDATLTAGKDVVIGSMQATVENNRLKALQNGWWGAQAIILISGLPCAIHFASVVLDSTPFWIPFFMDQAHRVGSWKVPPLPAPYDAYERDIVMSFFVVMPVMSMVGGFVTWLTRR